MPFFKVCASSPVQAISGAGSDSKSMPAARLALSSTAMRTRPRSSWAAGSRQALALFSNMLILIFFKKDACAKSQNQQIVAELHAVYSELSVNNVSMH
jgi:hypothetical protein